MLFQFKFDRRLDVRYLNILYEDNYKYALDLFEIYVHVSVNEMKRFKDLMESDDLAYMKMKMHKLKPNFAMVGLTWLSDAGQNLESLIGREQISEARELSVEMYDSFVRTFPIIRKEHRRLKKYCERAAMLELLRI